jgi:diguanylate cyclase (GGDEF)-like protein/PAS domain S-box-containing protein
MTGPILFKARRHQWWLYAAGLSLLTIASACVVATGAWFLTLAATASATAGSLALIGPHLGRLSRLPDPSKHRTPTCSKAWGDVLFHSAFEHAGIGMAVLAPDGSLLKTNSALARILGYTCAELESMTFADITHAEDLETDVQQYQRLLTGEIDHYALDKRYRCKDGSVISGRLNVSAVRDESGKPAYCLGQVEDISQQKEAEQKLRRLVARDSLTGLYSRGFFMQRLREAVDGLLQGTEGHFAVLYIDLNGFKQVNDEHGHGAGDQLLMSVASRLEDRLQRFGLRTGCRYVFARIGGDEFTVLLAEADQALAEQAAGELLGALSEGCTVNRTHVEIGGCIGIACSEADLTHDRLLQLADDALYEAKQAGAGSWRVSQADEAADRRRSVA